MTVVALLVLRTVHWQHELLARFCQAATLYYCMSDTVAPRTNLHLLIVLELACCLKGKCPCGGASYDNSFQPG